MSKSILTKYTGNCIFCGRPTTEQHHLLFGNSSRDLAEKDGIKIPACSFCHTANEPIRRIHGNPMAEKLSKISGQLAWEKHCVANGSSEEEARELFRNRYGKSFL